MKNKKKFNDTSIYHKKKSNATKSRKKETDIKTKINIDEYLKQIGSQKQAEKQFIK